MALAERRDGTWGCKSALCARSATRVINFGAVAMSKEAALNLLSRLEEILTNSKTLADVKGLNEYYTRDVQFLEQAKSCLTLGDHQSIQWVFDQMRNLSQGFGSYSSNQTEIDAMLDRLFMELQNALISTQ
jgi:hypothetical protein